MTTPAYFSPQHFRPGQPVMYGEFRAAIVRHYAGGMWDIRLSRGSACVSGADLRPITTPRHEEPSR